MAGRIQHVQDSAVAERRLRPIYEWLDSGNSKKALQEAEKVLRKTPNLQCARALKALSLLQLGREQECLTILKALTEETPSDNSTLQAMTVCYRDLQQLDQVCNLYKAAVEADPTNEDLHTHLFMSYVRTSNFKMQQQSAMTLYKMKQKNPYYFWAVMSIVLQASRGQGSYETAKKLVLLKLAERMVDKLISENRLEAEQEVQLYLMILELQDKNEEALAVLDGPLGIKLMNGSNDHSRIPYLIKLNRWKDLNLLCKDLLSQTIDRWDLWKHYLVSVFELYNLNATENTNNHVENHDCGDTEGPDDNPDKAHEFICSLIEQLKDDNIFTSSSSYQLRGPYLARFELCDRLEKIGKDPSHLLGDTFELFVEYFRIFGHKPCCVSDMKVFLKLLEPKRRLDLASRILKDVGINSTTLPQSEKQMQRHICSLQLSRMCGSHNDLDIEYLKAFIMALSLHYQNGAQTFGLDRLATDQGPADPYALLAAHVLYDQAVATKSSAPVIEALILLESLLKKSPSNFHAKLLCVRLYHLLGGGEGAQKIYESLDTKHLQIDSLGFLHCTRLQTTGLFTLASNHYDVTLKFFTTNYRDSIDHLTFSYKFGSFLKLEEFMDFRERLNNSLHYTMTAIDRMILEMIHCTSLKGLDNIEASPKNNNIDWEALRDNSDYGVYLSWDPERIEIPIEESGYVRRLFLQEKQVAGIRASIVWGISSAMDVLKATEENREQYFKILEDVITDWEIIFDNIDGDQELNPLVAHQLCLPLPSRLHSHLEIPFRTIFGALFKLVYSVATGNKEMRKSAKHKASEGFLLMMHIIRGLLIVPNRTKDNLWDKRQTLEAVVNVVEITGLSCLLCAICFELIRPAQGKKGKKKCATDNELREDLINLVHDFTEIVVYIDRALSSWKEPKNPLDITEGLGALTLSDMDSSAVHENLVSSHINAVKELRAVLNSKIKYLNQLIC